VGLNLLLSVSIASAPGLSSDGRLTTLARCYSDLSSNTLYDVIDAHCYFYRGPLVSVLN
jgi:hypothetical protein